MDNKPSETIILPYAPAQGEEKLRPAPIIKPAVVTLLESVQRILRSIGRSNYPMAKEAEETRERVSRLLSAMGKKRMDDQQIFAEWKPTEANIKALPSPIRKHIDDCEQLIKDNEAVRETLSTKMEELELAIRKLHTDEAMDLLKAIRGML